MAATRAEQIIRHFRENGLKLLLEQPGKVRDLLALCGTPLLGRLDFAGMRVALVYPDRQVPEREPLREVIVASVRTDARRREVETMTKTIADALREEGASERLGEIGRR